MVCPKRSFFFPRCFSLTYQRKRASNVFIAQMWADAAAMGVLHASWPGLYRMLCVLHGTRGCSADQTALYYYRSLLLCSSKSQLFPANASHYCSIYCSIVYTTVPWLSYHLDIIYSVFTLFFLTVFQFRVTNCVMSNTEEYFSQPSKESRSRKENFKPNCPLAVTVYLLYHLNRFSVPCYKRCDVQHRRILFTSVQIKWIYEGQTWQGDQISPLALADSAIGVCEWVRERVNARQTLTRFG